MTVPFQPAHRRQALRHEAFLAGAARIAHHLCSAAIWYGKACTWITDDADGERGSLAPFTRTMNGSYYDGTLGVAAFLAAMARETGTARFAETAAGALRHALAFSAEARQGGAPGSLFEGRLGSLSLGLSLADTLPDPEPGALYRAAIPDFVAAFAPNPEDSDLMHGAAGSILALRYLSSVMDDLAEACRGKAIALGATLIAAAQKPPAGWHWPTEDTVLGLCGLSHGNSGIALAFAALQTIDADARWPAARDAALRYEDHWFLEDLGNWPYLFAEDATSFADRPRACGMAWCHGAPGIALARLALWRLTGDDRHRQVAVTALRTTSDDLTSPGSACGASPTLCHGRAGNADILISAARALGEPGWLDAAQLEAEAMLARHGARTEDWPSGLGVVGGASDGLVLGRAGTGAFLLRAARPHVNSFLLPLFDGGF